MLSLYEIGGVQHYLQYIFGDIFGFLAGWTWVMAVMPATLAILSIVFVESIFSAAGVTNQAESIEHKLLSVAVLAVINGVNSFSTKVSTQLNNIFVVTKFVSIAALVIAGLAVVVIQTSNSERRDIGGRDWYTKHWFGFRDAVNPDGSKTHWGNLSDWELIGHLSAALYGALWAYSGWDKVTFGLSLRERLLIYIGHLHLSRAVSTGSSASTRYQLGYTHHHLVLYRR
jgi:amino acid transporter